MMCATISRPRGVARRGSLHAPWRPARHASSARVHARLPDMDGLRDAWARWTDSNKEHRMEVLQKLYTQLDRTTADGLLAPDFVVCEAGHIERCFGREEYIHLLYDVMLPAIPDFRWCFATNNEIDHNGYVIVTVQASGHHTGAPFVLPGLPPLAPNGTRVHMPEEAHMVKVWDGVIKEVKVFPVRGSGTLALYTMLGGELPDWQAKTLAREAQEPEVVMPVP